MSVVAWAVHVNPKVLFYINLDTTPRVTCTGSEYEEKIVEKVDYHPMVIKDDRFYFMYVNFALITSILYQHVRSIKEIDGKIVFIFDSEVPNLKHLKGLHTRSLDTHPGDILLELITQELGQLTLYEQWEEDDEVVTKIRRFTNTQQMEETEFNFSMPELHDTIGLDAIAVQYDSVIEEIHSEPTYMYEYRCLAEKRLFPDYYVAFENKAIFSDNFKRFNLPTKIINLSNLIEKGDFTAFDDLKQGICAKSSSLAKQTEAQRRKDSAKRKQLAKKKAKR